MILEEKLKMKNLLLSSSRWLWHYIIAYLFCNCFLNLTTPINGSVETVNKNDSDKYGWVNPEGMVVKLEGENLEIFCTINSTIPETADYTSSNLRFLEDGHLMDSDAVTMVNKTTIRLYLSYIRQSNHFYICFLHANKATLSDFKLPRIHNSGGKKNSFDHYGNYPKTRISPASKNIHRSQITIGSLRVVVGCKPDDIWNFKCSLFRHELTCSWNFRKNTVETNYTIQRELSEFGTFEKPTCCSDNTFWIDQECKWKNFSTISDNSYFNFTMTGVNMFGTNRQVLIYDKFKVKFDPFFSVREVTSTSIMIKWEFFLYRKGKAIISYETKNVTIELCYRNYRQHVINRNCSQYHYNTVDNYRKMFDLHNFTQLTPNSMYELSFRYKLSEAPQDQKYWSDYEIKFCETPPLLPENGMNLFQIFHTSKTVRRVHTFWTPKIITRNYNIRTYNVFVVNDEDNPQLTDLQREVPRYEAKSDSVVDWRATFNVGLSAYHFVRKYENGENDETYESNIITIPTFVDEVELCALFYVVQYANDTYEYIWQPPEQQLDIVNYTIFWHQNDREKWLPFRISWTYVSTNQSEIPFNFGPCIANFSKSYANHWKFYIGANTEKFSGALQQSMELVSSVSDFWRSERFLELQQDWLKKNNSMQTKTKAESDSKTRLDIGQRFSEDQFHDWMKKLHGVEKPVTCKGCKNVIRIGENIDRKVENS